MTTEPEKPEYVYEPWGQTLLRVLKGGAWIAGIIVAFAFAMVGYNQLDLNGYIPHERTLFVYMTGNWLVGENRICELRQQHDAQGRPTGELIGLLCGSDLEQLEPHNMSITFKGVVDRKDMDGNERQIPDQWKCTRGSDNFTCEAMATPTKPSN
jgi:hypothetical protein